MLAYRPPNDDERKAFFAYLKQATSFTTWERAYKLQKPLVEIVEKAYLDSSNWSKTNDSIHIAADEYRSILSCHIAFRKALENLQQGVRRCFRWAYAPGHFTEGIRFSENWINSLGRYRYQGGADFPLERSPLWPEVWRSLKVASTAVNLVSGILEPREMDLPADVRGPEFNFDPFPGNPYLWHYQQRAILPDAPRLRPGDLTIIIRTGQTIPISGIWEPCESPHRPSVLQRLFTRLEPLPADVKVNPEACMNYLHAGSNAPTIAFPDDDYRNYGKPTSWCLLWRDDRYGENPVPSEEMAYTYPPTLDDDPGFPSMT